MSLRFHCWRCECPGCCAVSLCQQFTDACKALQTFEKPRTLNLTTRRNIPEDSSYRCFHKRSTDTSLIRVCVKFHTLSSKRFANFHCCQKKRRRNISHGHHSVILLYMKVSLTAFWYVTVNVFWIYSLTIWAAVSPLLTTEWNVKMAALECHQMAKCLYSRTSIYRVFHDFRA